jgi:hypothetical protein
LNCAVASTPLRLSFASSSSSLFFSAAATSWTSLSSRSRSTICCSFSVAFFSRSARLWARSAKDCHNITWSSVAFQPGIIKKKTHVVNGNNAHPQGLHILVIFKNIILPRGAILVNFPPWQPRARRQRLRYLCTRCSLTSWRLVNLRLVLDQVLGPSRSCTDGVNVNNSWGGHRSDVPSRSSYARFNSARRTLHP